jgi:hypothetical protein
MVCHLRSNQQRLTAHVESAQGAVPVLPPARFPGPLAEPAVPISTGASPQPDKSCERWLLRRANRAPVRA